MLNQNKKWRNEKGMALVVAILITSALVAVGSFAMVMTNTELDISRNDRFGKEAFYIAEAAPAIFSNVIETVFWEGFSDKSSYSSVGIIVDANLDNEVVNFYKDNDRSTDTPSNNPDITYNFNGTTFNADIDWRYAWTAPGDSLLTHMGYEGIGKRKETRTYYDIRYLGTAKGASVNIYATYKH